MKVPSIIQQKTELIVIILLFLITTFTFCKKDSNSTTNTNELKATVVVSFSDTVRIKAMGTKVTMGCGVFGGGNFIQGVNVASGNNAAIIIRVSNPNGWSFNTSRKTLSRRKNRGYI